MGEFDRSPFGARVLFESRRASRYRGFRKGLRPVVRREPFETASKCQFQFLAGALDLFAAPQGAQEVLANSLSREAAREARDAAQLVRRCVLDPPLPRVLAGEYLPA